MDGVQQLDGKWIVELSTEAHHLHIDDVVNRSKAGGLAPHIFGKHLARDRAVTVFQ